MKKILNILCLSGIILFSACDDFLDIEPKGQALLTTTEDYLNLIEDIDPSYEHSDSWVLCGDASWYKTEELKLYTYPMKSVSFFWDESYDRAGNTIKSDLYNNCYNRITKYNAIIDNINSATGPDSDKTLGIAQAKIMRAYNYFFLINTFAKPYDPATAYKTNGIIVREKMFESLEEKGIQQSVGYTYDFIQKDIEEAVSNLPHSAKNAFRPDKTFGFAFKAKVHLFKREIDQCIEACDSALVEARTSGKHSLWNMNTDYMRWAPQLLALGYPEMAIDEPQYVGMNDFVETVWKTRVTYDYDGPEQLLYQFGGTSNDPFPMYVTKEVLDLFEKEADMRYRCCIRYKAQHETAVEGSQDFATLAIKWNPSGIKLSEVYLMLAECYARKGDPESLVKSMQYLNTLRANRLITGRYTQLTTTDKDEAMKWVREERKRELFLTHNGFFDMRRFCTEFNETLTKEFEGKTYTLSPTSHLLTFPFPMNAMKTSDLIQNSK